MAHNLEITADKTASFAFSQQIGSAWHNLGTPLDGLSTAEEILAACRGDYTVSKHKILAEDPMVPGRMMETDRFMTVRQRPVVIDSNGVTGGENHVLGVVGSQYEVIQNQEALELALGLVTDVADRFGFDIDAAAGLVDCAGVLRDGKQFFATIPLPPVVLAPNDQADLHGRNLVVTTGHDGGTALQLVNSYVRAVCANTVDWALRSSERAVSVRHTRNADTRIVEAKSQLGLLLDAEEEFKKIALELMGSECSFAAVEGIANLLWPTPEVGETDRQRENREVRMATLREIWEGDTAVGAVGSNRWAAFNTLSSYFEHRQPTSMNRSERAVVDGAFGVNLHRVGQLLLADATA